MTSHVFGPPPPPFPPPPTRSSPHDLEAQSGRSNIEFTLKASKPVVLDLKPVDYSRVLVSDPTAILWRLSHGLGT